MGVTRREFRGTGEALAGCFHVAAVEQQDARDELGPRIVRRHRQHFLQDTQGREKDDQDGDEGDHQSRPRQQRHPNER